RLNYHRQSSNPINKIIAILLMLFGVVYQTSLSSTDSIFVTKPYFVSTIVLVQRISSALLYAMLGVLFLDLRGKNKSPISVYQRTDKSQVDRTETKAVFGLLSWVADQLEVDVAYLRVIAILLSILTFGLCGLLYFAAGL